MAFRLNCSTPPKTKSKSQCVVNSTLNVQKLKLQTRRNANPVCYIDAPLVFREPDGRGQNELFTVKVVIVCLHKNNEA